MFHKKNPLDAEWEKLIKSEAKFLNDRYVKKDSVLNKKLSEKVPEKLQSTLNKAFSKAFETVLIKGQMLSRKLIRKKNFRTTLRLMSLPMKFVRIKNL